MGFRGLSTGVWDKVQYNQRVQDKVNLETAGVRQSDSGLKAYDKVTPDPWVQDKVVADERVQDNVAV